MYPHINIATTIITNTNLCFVLNVILFPRFYQPVVNAGQPKFSPLLKNPSNIPIENSNTKPTIIGTPTAFNPSTTVFCPPMVPVVIASHAYFATIKPAPTNANIRSVLKTPCICVINSHSPDTFDPGTAAALAATAGTVTSANTAPKPPFRFGKTKGVKTCGFPGFFQK